MEVPTPLIWLGIGFCVSQSAIFSGLNLALFSVSRLRLEVEVAAGNRAAKQVVSLRADANGLLATILWGNVGINVLLALLSNSIMAGAAAFLFSTFVITLLGEIIPQAYLSRNALKMAALFIPLLKVYRVLLYPVAKPCALILDAWLGRESVHYFREQDLTEVIRRHMASDASDVGYVEGLGAINFLALDDVLLSQKGEPVDPASVLQIPVVDGHLIFPAFERRPSDPFLRQVNASGHKWVVLIDFSHGDFPSHKKIIGNLREAARSVGKPVVNTIALRGYAAEVVLIDLNEKLAQAQAEDIIRWGGTYEAG